MDGVIGKADQDVGSYVDDMNNALLSRVQRLDPIHVICGVSEREYLLYQDDLRSGRLVLPPGQKMRLQLQLANGKLYEAEGQVDYEEPGFNTATGIRQVRGLFPNPDRTLRPGQFVKVRVIGYLRPEAILIPQRSVIMNPLGAGVFVIDSSNKLEFRPVTPGKIAGDDWIIETGLKAGDRVMVDGLMKARGGPGMEVNPVLHGSPEAKAAVPPPGMGGPGPNGPPTEKTAGEGAGDMK
jgi:membrane fusion protein (multidrug efflux system)